MLVDSSTGPLNRPVPRRAASSFPWRSREQQRWDLGSGAHLEADPHPGGAIVNRIVSVASDTNPWSRLSVNARGIAGDTDWTGSGVLGLMISALCGSIPSWLRKSISICHPRG